MRRNRQVYWPRLGYFLGLFALCLFGAISIASPGGAGSKADPLTVASVTAATGDWIVIGVGSRNTTDSDSCISSATWGGLSLSKDIECISVEDPQAVLMSGRVTSGSTETVTVNFQADCQSTGHAVRVAVVTGLATSSVVNVSGQATDASWSVTSELSPSLTTTVASTIVIVLYAPRTDNISGVTDWNASSFSTSGYSESTGGSEASNMGAILGYRIVSSTGTYQADVDSAGTGGNAASCKVAAAYKEDTGGGGTAIKDVHMRGRVAAPR